MNRVPRSTRSQIATAEVHQSAVIAALIATGHHKIARRLARCQQAKQHRQAGWPWRCRSPGCWACRRTTTGRWWQAFHDWLTGPAVTLAAIPINGDPINAIRRSRKGLRDIRDRTARQDHRWRGVAMAGLADGDRALILIKHAGIDRMEVWATFERRWPEVMLHDARDIEPASVMSVADAAALARRRRGIEPIRIVVLPQVVVAPAPAGSDEPMPMVF